jgi:hypothetical protein
MNIFPREFTGDNTNDTGKEKVGLDARKAKVRDPGPTPLKNYYVHY